MEESDNARRIRRAYARWAETRGASADDFVAMMAEDVRLRNALDPNEAHPMAQEPIGIAAARDYLESLALNLEMLDFPTEEVVDGGDTIV